MSITIRKVTEQDTDAFLEMMKALATYHHQLEFVKIDRETFIQHTFRENPIIGACVAEKDGVLIGYVSYTKNFSIWAGSVYLNIDDVFVKQEYRSTGVGERMMNFVKQETRADGINMIRWESEKDNHKAIRFYERLGASLRVKAIFMWSV
ncbi:GNAT family N-acetyltransferase [Cesiribacter sp. SM1]|uniref:GNAT family N-acetyltransferase n=1 Tax=Cesiribacter sp. SM1 TaxID=2861196 RepID=UPI001CD4F4F1|nr:GNAT family N-acetyltransferase [Cesiribacter sp. SM1]